MVYEAGVGGGKEQVGAELEKAALAQMGCASNLTNISVAINEGALLMIILYSTSSSIPHY